MRIGIDASFLRKPNTGLGQVTLNFLRKLREFPISNFQFPNDTEVEFVLYLEEDFLPTDGFQLPDLADSSVAKFRKNIFLPLWKRDDLIRKIWWEKFLLPRRAKQDECDAFISLYQSTTIMPTKIKHIMIVHDLIPKLYQEYLNNWRKKLYWQLTERAIKKIPRIIAISGRTEKDIIQHLGVMPSKIAVVHEDVDPIYKKEVSAVESERVMQKYGLSPGYIYNGGGLEVRKNTEGVLRAYKILLENYASMMTIPPLVISGRMMPQLAPLITDVQQMVAGLELENEVKLLDFVPQEDMPALYKNSVFFVFPSHYEGFGLPVLEAMNQGIPVITSKTSALPEVGGDSVLYCKPDEIDDLAMVMRNMLLNEKLRDTLRLKGKERALKFSWERFIDKIIHIIEAE